MDSEGKKKSANVSSAVSDDTAKSVAYKSSDIGVKTAVKEDPFAKHKQRQATEKKRRRIIYLIAGIVSVIIIALVVWLIIALTSGKPSEPSSGEGDASSNEEAYENDTRFESVPEDVSKVYENAQKTYTDNGDVSAATKIFDDAIATAQEENNSVKVSQIQFTQTSFYSTSNQPEEVIKIKDIINADNLNNEQKGIFYNLVYLAYYDIGDYANAEYYSDLSGEYAYLGLQENGETELEE